MESRRVGGMRTRMEGGKEAGLHGGGVSKGRAKAAEQPLSECRQNSTACLSKELRSAKSKANDQ